MDLGADLALEVVHGHVFQLPIGRHVAALSQDLPREQVKNYS